MCSAHRVSIHGKDILIERGVDTDDISHLMVNLQLQWGHWGIKVNAVQIVHQQDLAVTFSTVTRLGPFRGLPDLDYDHISIGAVSLKRRKSSNSKLTEQRAPRTRRGRNTPFRN